jgi:hypothetical protein
MCPRVAVEKEQKRNLQMESLSTEGVVDYLWILPSCHIKLSLTAPAAPNSNIQSLHPPLPWLRTHCTSNAGVLIGLHFMSFQVKWWLGQRFQVLSPWFLKKLKLS